MLPDAASLDVSGAVVNPVFRATPWQAEQNRDSEEPGPARVLFVSESGVCRSVLALAFFQDLIRQHGLESQVIADAKASRDYNVGDGPEASAETVLTRVGLEAPPGFQARQFEEAADIVAFDLVIVMDKFTAADVLREVSVFDTINPAGQYSLKVRRLGSFHPQLAGRTEPDAQDITDPLYGNAGGDDEETAVAAVAEMIQASCQGLVQHLKQLPQGRGRPEVSCLRDGLIAWVRQTEAIDWLVPPMLQRK
ncbi:hypothetical protein N2152v2_008666 [Parachlorella kessleri]